MEESMKTGLGVFVIILCFLTTAFAQESWEHGKDLEKAIGAQEERPAEPASCPLKSWIGERFVFLPKPAKEPFSPVYGHFQAGNDLYRHPTYEDYVGKMVEAVHVRRLHDRWEVEFKMMDSGMTLLATTWSGGISGIAPVKDIHDAREKWLGKTLWYRKERMSPYPEAKGTADRIRVKPGTLVTVTDVVPGSDHNTPVRFVLKTPAGQTGYVDLAWSPTNVYPSAWRYCDKFSSVFYTRDPSKIVGVLASGS
jgi:hypothetical protein